MRAITICNNLFSIIRMRGGDMYNIFPIYLGLIRIRAHDMYSFSNLFSIIHVQGYDMCNNNLFSIIRVRGQSFIYSIYSFYIVYNVILCIYIYIYIYSYGS